ncbi:hypothetical protein AB5N19_12271 [Seiridium cardinale]
MEGIQYRWELLTGTASGISAPTYMAMLAAKNSNEVRDNTIEQETNDFAGIDCVLDAGLDDGWDDALAVALEYTISLWEGWEGKETRDERMVETFLNEHGR